MLAFLLAAAAGLAGYKARPWSLRARDTYRASLTSEGVTIAAEPLYTDPLAAQVFDKNDIITRGIMPLAVVIFNDNSFPIVVDGSAIQLICGEDRLRSIPVNEVVLHLFQKSGRSWIPQPVPRMPSVDRGNQEAFEDFEQKFLGNKIVEGHKTGGGFLYLHVPGKDIPGYLSKAQLYIPEIHRQDTGAELIYFEIDLQPAFAASPTR